MKHNLSLIFLILQIVFLSCERGPKQALYTEQHRPQFHFSPSENWMNDPNGLVYLDGEYHLFYQYYPDGTVWGPMHWGHAVSTDLAHWENLPIALYPDSLGYIFSGSAVIDWHNTSGFQKGENPPMIAIFTYHKDGEGQTQGIAFSNDKGRTFTKYSGNPVLPNQGENDFRDPSVFWHEESQKWIMTLAVKNRIEFYASSNLKEWNYLSKFSDAGILKGVWECTNLFPLNLNGEEKWVLIVSDNGGGPNGGAGTQYFIGDFNGTEFINDNPDSTVLFLDYGPDNFAGITWNNILENDGRKILMAWMSNWMYGTVTPTEKWRSAMTIPRQLELTQTSNGIRLISNPVKELGKLRKKEIEFLKEKPNAISGLNELIVEIELESSTADEFAFVFSNKSNEKIEVGFDTQKNQFFIDRSESGKVDFHELFGGKQLAPRISDNPKLLIHLVIDHSSVELFADDGLTCMTALFFPNENYIQLSLNIKSGEVNILESSLFELKSIWN